MECLLVDAQHKFSALSVLYGRLAYLSHEYVEYSHDEYEFVVYVKEPESDEEFNARVEAEKSAKAVREKRERIEYERLAAKFAKDSK